MRTPYFTSLTASLLVGAALLGSPAAAQNQPKGKVSAALLGLSASPGRAKASARSLSAQRQSPPATDPRFALDSELQIFDGYVVIEAVATTASAQQLLADLQAQGLRQGAAYGAMVSGLFPISQLAALEGVSSLRQVRPAYKPVVNVGKVTSQGDRAMHADVARVRYGATGKGVKVGILSDSYNNLGTAADGVASGDLPAAGVQVLEDLPKTAGGASGTGGSDEGRGMAEIVHDVAPDAAIAFHTAFLGQADFAQGIEDLQAAGSKVIVDDIFYFAEPFFQNGIIAQAAEKVVRQGSSYFSSAGNQADQSYEARFINSGTQVDSTKGEAHSFAPGDVKQSITVAPGATLILSLQWDEPFFSASGVRGSRSDLDLYILYQGSVVAASTDNNLGGDPVEITGIRNPFKTPITVEVVIAKFAGPDPTRIKYVNFGARPQAMEYDTKSSTVVGHANAFLATAVAAARYTTTPAFNPQNTTPTVEYFSSLGGTPLIFDDKGNRHGPIVLAKPDLTGPDGGNTTFFPNYAGADYDHDGFPNFFGTSASAPHVAAVAALLLDTPIGKYLPPLVLRGLLQATALDMDNPATPNFDKGFDFRTGFGFVQADAALARLNPNPQATAALQLVLSLFPNPASGQVNFRAVAPNRESLQLTVVDQMGKEVFAGTGTGELSLSKDFSGLPKGLYVARVQTSTEVKTQLLTVE